MSPLNAAGDVAKGLVDIRDLVKLGEAIIKLQAQILSAGKALWRLRRMRRKWPRKYAALKNR